MKTTVPQAELKKALRQFVDGHAAAAEFIAQEQARRLEAMTVEESTAEYDALCATWEANPHREGIEHVHQRKVEELLELRRKLNLAAGIKPK
jgi:glycerol kinase